MDQVQSKHPRHVLLADQLRDEIAAGQYAVGSRFPTEKDLQVRFATGRHTAREALKILTEQGLLGRRRKTGTVVLSRDPVSSYVHSLRDIRGLLAFAQSTVLDIQHAGFMRPSKRHAADFSEIDEGRWFKITGLRRMRQGARPLCWSDIMVPERFAPGRDEVSRGERAIYEIVMAQHALRLEYVEQTITGTQLPSQVARMLDAEEGAAALLVERRYVDHTASTFEISHNLYPADRYSIRSIIRQRA